MNYAKLPKKVMPNYRKKSCQITEKSHAKLPNIKKYNYICSY